jgi:hypothetical protein
MAQGTECLLGTCEALSSKSSSEKKKKNEQHTSKCASINPEGQRK